MCIVYVVHTLWRDTDINFISTFTVKSEATQIWDLLKSKLIFFYFLILPFYFPRLFSGLHSKKLDTSWKKAYVVFRNFAFVI